MTLNDDVAAWESRVKDARHKGDPGATLAIATAAADAIEPRAADNPAALQAVQRITFNAAADAWPGWEVQGDSSTLDEPTLVAGKRVAQRSAQLVDKLQLGAVKQATGVWLVAAFDLALGRLDEAAAGFSAALQSYVDAPAPGLALLTKGYLGIATGLKGKQSRQEIEAGLGPVFSEITAGGYGSGAEWIQQLRTALTVFAEPA